MFIYLLVLPFAAPGICRKCRERLVKSTETEIDDLPLAVKDLTLVRALTVLKMQVRSWAQFRFKFSLKSYDGTVFVKDRIVKGQNAT